MTTIKISDDGRITIPAAIRRELGLKPGDRLFVEVREDGIVLRRVKSFVELEGSLHEYAIPGMTWEKERDIMERAVAEDVVKKDLTT